MEGVVRLIVKAPNQQIEDQIIKCELGWTIGRLKAYLAEVYPSKPKTSDQKLIYSGQLLRDTVFLRDVLHNYEGGDQIDHSYTVHLVCAPTMPYYTDKGHSAGTNSQEQGPAVARPDAVPEPVIVDRLQSQSTENDEIDNPASSPAQLYSAQRYYNQLNSQQMAWMQQAYTHYLTQYMQLMAAQGIQLQSSIPYIQPLNANANEPTSNNNRDEQQRAAGPQGLAAGADPAEANNVNNNAAAAEDRGDGGMGLNRDWLDFFYMLSRVTVLFSIVYFYSSPLRFLIVTFLGFAVYLYQGGFFRVQPMLLVDNNNRVDNNNQILQNEAVGAQALPPQQPPPAPQTDTQVNPNEENEAQRPGALAFAWTFFSSFFASLIPDQPNVV